MKLFWLRIVDRVEYGITSVKLAIVDKICGPEPATGADQRREYEHARLQKAFPGTDIDNKRPKR
jgi:hypothetical protein